MRAHDSVLLLQVLVKPGGKKKYDLNPLRNAFQARDKNKTGRLKKAEVRERRGVRVRACVRACVVCACVCACFVCVCV